MTRMIVRMRKRRRGRINARKSGVRRRGKA
jgi:hypothetical protein